jgi:hypothetical protein
MKGSAFGPKHAHQRLPVSSLFAENLDYVALPLVSLWRYRVSLQRKKRCQQIIGLDDESFPIAVCIDAIK